MSVHTSTLQDYLSQILVYSNHNYVDESVS